jgi:hypothetical protein
MKTIRYERGERRYHLPDNPKLVRLLEGFDPEIGPFKLLMQRRHARDLRKWLFGPKGSRIVPEFNGNVAHFDGEMEFALPNGWRLRLCYGAPAYEIQASYVDAEFIPPPNRKKRPGQRQPKTRSTAQARA